MEFEFRRDVTGELQASFSMGHEAIAAWLLEEVGKRKAVLPELHKAIEKLQNRELWEYSREGVEYSLKLNRSEAEVYNSRIDFENADDEFDGLGEEIDFYDDESRSSCGLDDFKSMLLEWEQFVRH
ncbi:YacL family protein [Sansalvadorimonas sp. 2012CJ34-2]|uniref:YacL family protein n=1 Tax=Parendozoicomonas callyspongiae TaxID=2942213 RepID=A0ABT0PFG7_9GAMM|nr:YacL family protein [Sansalvadorimonas sp. 2012CJ34-2]MCL6270117.1 YacL family protein [Sansalvadorimonas sp. 2012CJ34-2]